MQTFAKGPSQTKERVPSAVARASVATTGPAHREHPILHLQRTLGNQAVLRMLQALGAEPKAGLTATESPRLGYDFSRIPIHPPAPAVIQTKLAINQPGDEYEQEADHVAEQVMRMPEPQLQRKCACGGACADCQKEESQHKLQMKSVSTAGPTQPEAPTAVHEVLRSLGQPLDPPTRAFMEPRFGRDFSGVRVHTDAAAAQSANELNANAYTTGQNIVFASGQYAPGTPDGNRLIAHELTHVMQQGFVMQQRVLQRDDKQQPVPPEKAPGADVDAAVKDIQNNWTGVAAAGSQFPELKQWIVQGNAVIALIQNHATAALAAINGNNHVLVEAYKQVLASDTVMYEYIAWHVISYANLLSLRSGIDGLVNAFDHDSDVGFGLHYFRNFKGRAEADRIARQLKKAIDGAPANSAQELSLVKTDVQLSVPQASQQITVTSASIPGARKNIEELTNEAKRLQINLQRGVDYENQFLDEAFKAGGQQAIDNVREYYTLKKSLEKSGSKKGEQTKEDPEPLPHPVPAPVEGDEDEEKKKRGTMRHQIQQGRNNHYASLGVAALDENGVTGRQLRDTMATNFGQYMAIAKGERDVPLGWKKGPVSWEKPIRAAIISQSQAIPGIVAAGGVTLGGDINALRRCFDPGTGNPSNCASDDVRLDVENRGHNLRRES